MLNQFLASIGLSEKETKVYLALLQIGSQPVSTIAHRSQLTRTTVYSVLESLEKKELIFSYEKNNILYYTPKSPQTIKQQLENKSNVIKNQIDEFSALLPEFLALNQNKEGLPKVQYFEGIEGIKQIYEDTLTAKNGKLAYSSIPDSENKALKTYIKTYIKKRTKNNIRVRAILPDTKNSRAFTETDEALLRSTRLIPAHTFPFQSEINIYNNKIAMISLKSSLLHGVIIESESIANTQRSIFELAWLGAKEVMKMDEKVYL